jgi:hypothetical protein
LLKDAGREDMIPMKMMKEKPDHFFIFEPVNSAVCHLHPRGETDTLFFSENIPALPEMSREETLQITAREAMNLTLLNDPSVEKMIPDFFMKASIRTDIRKEL